MKTILCYSRLCLWYTGWAIVTGITVIILIMELPKWQAQTAALYAADVTRMHAKTEAMKRNCTLLPLHVFNDSIFVLKDGAYASIAIKRAECWFTCPGHYRGSSWIWKIWKLADVDAVEAIRQSRCPTGKTLIMWDIRDHDVMVGHTYDLRAKWSETPPEEEDIYDGRDETNTGVVVISIGVGLVLFFFGFGIYVASSKCGSICCNDICSSRC